MTVWHCDIVALQRTAVVQVPIEDWSGFMSQIKQDAQFGTLDLERGNYLLQQQEVIMLNKHCDIVTL